MMERIRGGGDRRERARALGGSYRDVRSMFHDYDTIEDAMYATQVTQEDVDNFDREQGNVYSSLTVPELPEPPKEKTISDYDSAAEIGWDGYGGDTSDLELQQPQTRKYRKWIEAADSDPEIYTTPFMDPDPTALFPNPRQSTQNKHKKPVSLPAQGEDEGESESESESERKGVPDLKLGKRVVMRGETQVLDLFGRGKRGKGSGSGSDSAPGREDLVNSWQKTRTSEDEKGSSDIMRTETLTFDTTDDIYSKTQTETDVCDKDVSQRSRQKHPGQPKGNADVHDGQHRGPSGRMLRECTHAGDSSDVGEMGGRLDVRDVRVSGANGVEGLRDGRRRRRQREKARFRLEFVQKDKRTGRKVYRMEEPHIDSYETVLKNHRERVERDRLKAIHLSMMKREKALELRKNYTLYERRAKYSFSGLSGNAKHLQTYTLEDGPQHVTARFDLRPLSCDQDISTSNISVKCTTRSLNVTISAVASEMMLGDGLETYYIKKGERLTFFWCDELPGDIDDKRTKWQFKEGTLSIRFEKLDLVQWNRLEFRPIVPLDFFWKGNDDNLDPEELFDHDQETMREREKRLYSEGRSYGEKLRAEGLASLHPPTPRELDTLSKTKFPPKFFL